VIERIGIRASVLRLANGATVIVPNSGLITERITNRALTNPETHIEIRVGVAYGVDPRTVVSLLTEIAGQHKHVSKSPPPEVLFSDFAENGVYFLLRVTIDDPAQLVQTKSELGMAINSLFSAGKLRPPARQNVEAAIEDRPSVAT
jgi:small-conductance mechanosensitive channel